VRKNGFFYFFSLIFVIAISYQAIHLSIWDIPVNNSDAKKYFVGEQKIFNSPVQLYGISPDGKDYLIPFSQPINVSGFSFLFVGNLHAVSSFLAKNFAVYKLSLDNKWVLIEKIKGNNKTKYTLNLESNFLTKGFKVHFHDGLAENSVWLQSLKFYSYKRVNCIEYFKYLFKNTYNTPIGYYLFPALLYILLIIPGYTLLIWINENWISNKNQTSEHLLVFAPVISIVILTILSTLFLFTDVKEIFYIYILLFLFSSVYFIFQGHFYKISANKNPIIIVIIACFILISIQATRDFLFNTPYFDTDLSSLPKGSGYFGYHTDNTGPWSFSRVLLNSVSIFSNTAHDYFIGWEPTFVFQRPPLLALLAIPFMHFFGEGHFIYNSLLILLVGLYFQASYILIKQEFGFKIAGFVCLFLLLNMQLVYSPNNSEVFVKYFAIYFSFLALIFFSTPKGVEPRSLLNKDVLCSLFLGLSFFAHPIALAIILLLLILICLTYRVSQISLYRSIIISSFPFLVFIGWYIWIPRIYPQPVDKEVDLGTNTYLEVLSKFSIESIQNKVFNFINIFFPKVMIAISSGKFPNDIWHHFFRYSIISAVSPLLLFLLVIFFKKGFHKQNLKPLLFAFAPLFLFILAIPTYSLGGWSVFYPFCLPFIFSLIAVTFLQMNIRRQIMFALTYIFWMGAIIITISGLVSNYTFPSALSVVFLSCSLGAFILLAIFLIRFIIKNHSTRV
jgi:hypothetical protein